MSSAAKVELFFDCVSPYTHLALNQWAKYCRRWPVALSLRPMFLGGVMQATGNKPPGMLPQKASFLAEDLRRSSSMLDIALLPTPGNFFSEVARAVVSVQRILCAAQGDGLSAERQLELAIAFSNCIH